MQEGAALVVVDGAGETVGPQEDIDAPCVSVLASTRGLEHGVHLLRVCLWKGLCLAILEVVVVILVVDAPSLNTANNSLTPSPTYLQHAEDHIVVGRVGALLHGLLQHAQHGGVAAVVCLLVGRRVHPRQG